MKPRQLILFLMMCLLSFESLLAATQTTMTTLNLTYMYSSKYEGGLDLLDAIFTHRYKLYINMQYFHTFENLSKQNTFLTTHNGYLMYETKLTFTGEIPCDNENPIAFNASLFSDTNGDQIFDWETPKSETHYLDIRCLNAPQNFTIVF